MHLNLWMYKGRTQKSTLDKVEVVVSNFSFIGSSPTRQAPSPTPTPPPAPPTPRQISAFGQQWSVRSSSGAKQGPGPNIFSDNTSNVFSASDGLHLIATREQTSQDWQCVEVWLERELGYGIYDFSLATPVDDLGDPNVVLGLFLCKDDTHEIDIEFAQWGGGWPMESPPTL